MAEHDDTSYPNPDRAGADGATRTPPAPGAGPAPIHLSALRIHPAAPQPRPAPVRRDWMDATDSRFANRCLPLLLANQAGWLISSTCTASIRWTGGPRPDSLTVWTNDETSLRPTGEPLRSGRADLEHPLPLPNVTGVQPAGAGTHELPERRGTGTGRRSGDRLVSSNVHHELDNDTALSHGKFSGGRAMCMVVPAAGRGREC